MPKYSYICKSCNTHKQKYASAETTTIICDCGKNMDRQIPTVNKANVTEVADAFFGISLPIDNDEILKERKLDYYWSVEVPRLCNNYSPAHCLQNGWAYINEKGEYCIHTRPPNKR